MRNRKFRNINKKSLLILITILLMINASCSLSLSEAEVRNLWTEISAEYPGCKIMPRIILKDDGTIGGYYARPTHTIVIDKYAADWVWEHEFRHACGDMLLEQASYYKLHPQNCFGW